MARLLLIEDDPEIREGLELALGHLGHEVLTRADGESGLAAALELAPEAIILDVMLPGIDGFEVCRRLRHSSVIPVIMLTARSDDMDVVVGLEAGADDYVAKPVRPRVLDARIKAVLRRSPVAGPTPAPGSTAAPGPGGGPTAAPGLGGGPTAAGPERFGAISIDRAGLQVTRDDTPVALTPMELKLLLEISSHPGQVYSREALLASVWDQHYLGDSRLVDACVQRLRAKIETDSAHPQMIETVRGFGYRFRAP